jgi:hypothetical protein
LGYDIIDSIIENGCEKVDFGVFNLSEGKGDITKKTLKEN